jgi:SPX domain protein involved in polyphosphate accumulation
MKFGKILATQSIEEWRSHYINYQARLVPFLELTFFQHLKVLIRTLLLNPNGYSRGNLGSVGSTEEIEKVAPFPTADPFVIELDKQLVQCSTFYEQKEAQVGDCRFNFQQFTSVPKALRSFD